MDAKPIDTAFAARREALRERLALETPSWYNPWVHLAVPSLFGLAILLGCVLGIRDLQAWELLAIPATYATANLGEWWVHKYVLHRRRKIAAVLYDQHTPKHHMVYITDDMAMRDRNEFRLVLIPAYGIMLIFLANLAPTAALWFGGLHNMALMFTATVMGYVLSYEWLHLAYHLPEGHPIGRSSIIRRLRHHHAIHHDPKLMQEWNFNVTVPLSDWICGTTVKDAVESGRQTGELAQPPKHAKPSADLA